MFFSENLGSEDIEIALLGSIIKDQKGLVQYMLKLEPDDFTTARHKSMVLLVKKMMNLNKAIDVYSLRAAAKEKFVKKEYEMIRKIFRFEADPKKTDGYYEKVKELSNRRKVGQLLSEANLKNNDTLYPHGDVITQLMDAFQKITFSNSVGEKSAADYILDMEKRAIAVRDGTLPLYGMSGIPYVDEFVTLEGNEFIVIAADSHEGKSWIATQVACHYAKNYGWKVKIFSMEMSGVQVMRRLVSNESGLDAASFRRGTVDLNSEAYLNARKFMMEEKIQICERGGLTLGELERRIYDAANQGVKAVVIDHGLLLDMSTLRDSEDRIGAITGKLKALSRNLDIVIIALWQMTKEIQKSPDGEPFKGMIRGSGMVYADCDICIAPWRPEAHGANYITLGSVKVQVRGKGIWKILKNRVDAGTKNLFLLDWCPELGGYFDPNTKRAIAGQMEYIDLPDEDDTPF